MKIKDKLAYSQLWDRIYFFKEGMFVQLYGVSLYLALKEINLNIKVHYRNYKMISDKPILRAGFPISGLNKLSIGDLKEREFGYELPGAWERDIEGYRNWYREQLAILGIGAEKNREQLIEKQLKPLWLTEKEYCFLCGWRKGKYPLETEYEFILRLQQKIASSNAKRTGSNFFD